MTKPYKIDSQVFAVGFLCPSSSKHTFSIPLKKHTVFELLLQFKNNYFLFLQMCKKCPKTYCKKKLKTKARYKNSTINLVFKSCHTLAENYLINFIFPQNWQVSLSQKNFSVIETHLTVTKL